MNMAENHGNRVITIKNSTMSNGATFHAFQGEFARVFNPKRGGQVLKNCRLDEAEDNPDYHAYHLFSNRNWPKLQVSTGRRTKE